MGVRKETREVRRRWSVEGERLGGVVVLASTPQREEVALDN